MPRKKSSGGGSPTKKSGAPKGTHIAKKGRPGIGDRYVGEVVPNQGRKKKR